MQGNTLPDSLKFCSDCEGFFAWRSCQVLFLCLCLHPGGFLRVFFVSGISASKRYCNFLFANLPLKLHWISLALSRTAWWKLGLEKAIKVPDITLSLKNLSENFEMVKLGNWYFSERFSQQLYGVHRFACLQTPCNAEVHNWQEENKENEKGLLLHLQN